MAKISTNILIDEELKQQAKELFAEMGMDLSTAVVVFLRQCVFENGLPFKPSRYKDPNENKK